MLSAAGGVTGGFEIMRSWAVAVHVHAGLPGGIIVGSAYMESVNGGDFNTANFKKLMRIAECMRYFSAPFLFAGDCCTSTRDCRAGEHAPAPEG